jgi:hypothetical protein
MPRLNLDLSEAVSIEPVPDDEYTCKISAVSEVKSGPNSQYVNVEFTVADGEFTGRKIWRNYPISGKGAGFFIELANKAIDAGLEPGDPVDFDTDDLIGASIGVVTKMREYPEGSGKYSNEVDRLLAI